MINVRKIDNDISSIMQKCRMRTGSSGSILCILIIIIFSVGCATSAESTSIKSKTGGTAILSQYLDNVSSKEYEANYKLLSKKVVKEWLDLNVKDASAYAGRFETREKRLLDHAITQVDRISSKAIEVTVTQRETFEDPTVHSNAYRYKVISEDGAWKVDQYITADGKYSYLP